LKDLSFLATDYVYCDTLTLYANDSARTFECDG
jgi:hypothetical protein